MNQMMVSRFLGGLFLLLGVIFVIVSMIITVSSQRKKKHCTQIVRAKIISVNEVKTLQQDRKTYYYSYYPVYQYEYLGKSYEIQSNVGNKKEAYTIDEVRTIYINPEKATEIWEDSYVVPLLKMIFLAVGIILLIASGVAFMI